MLDSLNLAIDKIFIDTLHVKSTPVALIHPENPEKWISLVTLCIALLAVFVGPTIQYIIGKRSIRTQNSIAHDSIKAQMDELSYNFSIQLNKDNRQEWINTFREDVASLISLLYKMNDLDGFIDETESKSILYDLYRAQTKILLLLNPLEDGYNDFTEKIESATLMVGKKPNSEFESILQEILLEAQSIIKKEWERIKYTGVKSGR